MWVFFKKPIKQLLENKKLLKLGILVNFLTVLVVLISEIIAFPLIADLLILNVNSASLLLSLLQEHWISFLVLILSAIIYSVLQFFLMVYYSRYVKNKKKDLKSLRIYAISRLKDITLMALLFFISIIGIGIVLQFVINFIPGVLDLIVIALMFLAIIYFYLKFTVSIAVLAIEDKNVVQSLKKSWNFSNTRLWSLFLLNLGLGVFFVIFNVIGEFISLIIDDLVLLLEALFYNEALIESMPILLNFFDPSFYEGILFIFINTIIISYVSLAIANYYYSEK